VLGQTGITVVDPALITATNVAKQGALPLSGEGLSDWAGLMAVRCQPVQAPAMSGQVLATRYRNTFSCR
jgi:hypothetical protein